MAIVPYPSDKQGQLGRMCDQCGEVFFIKSAGVRYAHTCNIRREGMVLLERVTSTLEARSEVNTNNDEQQASAEPK